jgi:hypothetical protein
MVQPFTVITLAEAEAPGLLVVIELETEPPPAWTWTDEPPAEELLERPPDEELLDAAPAPPPENPRAVMLPSACFSTVTLQVCPNTLFPSFVMVSA